MVIQQTVNLWPKGTVGSNPTPRATLLTIYVNITYDSSVQVPCQEQGAKFLKILTANLKFSILVLKKQKYLVLLLGSVGVCGNVDISFTNGSPYSAVAYARCARSHQWRVSSDKVRIAHS